ncbi:sugar transporter STL1 [Rhizodiscina lignyota]|uniref:Sugar transporter STL1 n=1 Tax=Rhizodiscina lignyota TaxID=1504668 RepID=A0A9P4I8D0_9PEZI|nr:sugar transporter STL1 [Rhizodiscina lignyota]
MRLEGRYLRAAVMTCAGFGYALFGYDQGVLSGLLLMEQFVSQYKLVNADGSSKAAVVANIVALYEIGCAVGALSVMPLGERLGRKRAMYLGCSIMIVGALIQTTSYNVPQLIAGRIITGVGNGINTSTIPVWQGELTRPVSRGRDVSVGFVLNIFGLAVAYWIGYGTSFLDSSASFRFPIAFQIFFALGVLFMLPFLPESPRWLMFHGDKDQATKVLANTIGRKGLEIDDPAVVAESRLIQETIDLELEIGKKFAISELFSVGESKNLYRILLCAVVGLGQQLSGINVISYYLTIVFNTSIHLSPDLSRLMAGFNGLEYMVATILACFTIDHFGRRNLLMIGAAGQAASLFILCGLVKILDEGSNSKGAAGVAAAMLFLFNTFFGPTWLPIPWLYPTEITTLRLRSKGAAIATFAIWISCFAVAEFTPPAIQNLGWRLYLMFGIFNVGFIVIVYFCFPETSRKRLEEIDYIFNEDFKTRNKVGKAPIFLSTGDEVEEARKAENNEKGKGEMVLVEESGSKCS